MVAQKHKVTQKHKITHKHKVTHKHKIAQKHKTAQKHANAFLAQAVHKNRQDGQRRRMTNKQHNACHAHCKKDLNAIVMKT